MKRTIEYCKCEHQRQFEELSAGAKQAKAELVEHLTVELCRRMTCFHGHLPGKLLVSAKPDLLAVRARPDRPAPHNGPIAAWPHFEVCAPYDLIA